MTTEETIVTHVYPDRYIVEYERSAVKGVDGFKVRAEASTREKAIADGKVLLDDAITNTDSPMV
tara:strand:+ start:16 stop:207 length:192 start_codon:yes stop_codon:yes gene_type:complete